MSKINLKFSLKLLRQLSEQRDKLYATIDDVKNKRIKNDIHLKELADKLEEIAGKA